MVDRIRYRLRQGFAHLRPAAALPAEQRSLVAEILTESQSSAFLTMPLREQVHHCCVAQTLVDAGQTDPDLLQAALLHDIGKCDGQRCPSVAERTIAVLTEAVSTRLFQLLTTTPRFWNRGLRLIAGHEQRGAEIAATCGSNPRVQALIALHGEASDPTDEQLTALQRADGAC